VRTGAKRAKLGLGHMIRATAHRMLGDGALFVYPKDAKSTTVPLASYTQAFGGATNSTLVKRGANGEICVR
jgi:hypothetical protein